MYGSITLNMINYFECINIIIYTYIFDALKYHSETLE
jgi:hypothetical protein